MGPWLMEQMLGQARHVGTDIIQDSIVSVDSPRALYRARRWVTAIWPIA